MKEYLSCKALKLWKYLLGVLGYHRNPLVKIVSEDKEIINKQFKSWTVGFYFWSKSSESHTKISSLNVSLIKEWNEI